jgi:hypothetical protein
MPNVSARRSSGLAAVLKLTGIVGEPAPLIRSQPKPLLASEQLA